MKYCQTTDVVKDTGQLPIVQITFLERVIEAAVAEPYGVHSSPKKSSPCLLLEVNGDQSNRVVIPLSAFNRTKGLEETEVEYGNFEIGSIIKFDKDGNINIKAVKNVDIDASDITANCDITVTGGDVVADGISLKNHTHPAQGSLLDSLSGTVSGDTGAAQ